jgi:hypothetical protein
MMAFSVQLVDAFSILAKPYDIVHPIFEFPLDSLGNEVLSSIIAGSRAHGALIVDLSDKGNSQDHKRYVIHQPTFLNFQKDHFPPCVDKIRLFWDGTSNVLRIEPVLLLRAPVYCTAFCAPTPAFRGILDDLASLLETSTSTDHFRTAYMLRLFLAELSYGLLFLQYMSTSNRAFDGARTSLSTIDTELLFGLRVAKLIFAASQLTLTPEMFFLQNEARSDEHPPHDSKVLFNISKPFLDSHIHDDMPLAIKVSAIMKSLRPLDINTRTSEHRRYRLDFGYTFDDLVEILARYSSAVPEWQLSATLDYLVDAGVAVPVTPGSGDGITKAFRFGESREQLSRLRYTVYTACNELIERTALLHKKPPSAVPNLYTSKALLFLAQVGSSSGQLTMRNLGVTLKFHRFGAELDLEDDLLSEPRILPWAMTQRVLSTGQRGISLHPSFGEMFPPLENPLDATQRVLISTAMLWFADASWKLKDTSFRYRLALSLTTCNTAAHTIAAVKEELRLWYADRILSARQCLNLFADLIAPATVRSQDAIRQKASQLLDLCGRGPADAMAQSKLKVAVFKELAQRRDELDQTYTREAAPALEIFYSQHVRPLLVPSASSLQQHELDVLDLIGRCCQRWTTALSTAVSEFGGLTTSSKVALTVGHAFDLFNQEAKRLHIYCPKYRIVARLKLDEGEALSLNMEHVYKQLFNALSDVEELLKTAVFTKAAGAPIQLREEAWLILYDWIDSSGIDDQVGAQMAQQINTELQTFIGERLDERYEPTLDDENYLIIMEAGNLAPALYALIEALDRQGLAARIAIEFAGRGADALLRVPESGLYGGRPFVSAVRIRDVFKAEAWMHNGKSHILVSEHTRKKLAATDFSEAGFTKRTSSPIVLRGKDFSPVDIYEYSLPTKQYIL